MSDQAFAIGECGRGDRTVELFQRAVEQLHYDFEVLDDYAKAQTKLRDRSAARAERERDLVLFCVGPALRTIREHLEALRAPNRQVIVYADDQRASTHVAVEYCQSGLAHDFLVWDEKNYRVPEHVYALHDGKCPYPKIDVPFVRTNGVPRVFIATPYDPWYKGVMVRAVDPVLHAVGLNPCWADDPVRDSTVPDTVRNAIDQSVFLIANISQGPRAVHNPNVYYEAGQASALGKPVIFVRPLDEGNLLVPADISARRRIEYDNPVDLAMRLYHGLKQ